MQTHMLETELAYFERNRETFVKEALEKYVLIKGEQHIGFYDNQEEAYRVGVELFGLQPFLIKRVLREDQIHEIPAYYLGLTHATV